jgi:hypothetical protein
MTTIAHVVFKPNCVVVLKLLWLDHLTLIISLFQSSKWLNKSERKSKLSPKLLIEVAQVR